MKSSTTKLTTAVAVAALLALPITAAAQTPPSQPPATAQPPATGESAQSASQDTGTRQAAPAEAREHLAKAKAALVDINTQTLEARAKSQITELNRRVNALERAIAANDNPSGADPQAATATAGNANWGAEIGAIDRILTTLLGTEATAGTTTPQPTGTSGGEAQIDETTRTKLVELRTHLTAFATAMAGGKSNAATAPTAQPTGTPDTEPQPPTATPGQPPAQTTQPDEQDARRHLTAARNMLSEVTQMPQAAQLTGETRTHVAQLISNFNELITAQTEWRASYAKVSANLTSLLGPEIGTPDPSGAPGTAVGTSGTPAASLDAEIRSKLMEFRRHLAEFEKAASGGAAQPPAAGATPSSEPNVPATAPPTTEPPSSTPPTATPPTATPPSATPPSTTPPETNPPQTTGPPSTTGTSGTQAAGNAEILRHIAAIEAMLKSEDDSGGVTLTKMQLTQLRTHLASLRQAVEKR